MTPEQAKFGVRVRTLVDWPGVPAGSEGIIIEDYKTGVMVAWLGMDRKDGFNKQDLAYYLELHEKYAAEILDEAITEHDALAWRIEHPNFGGTS